LKQRRSQKLKGVPYQRAVENSVVKVQRCIQKFPRHKRIRLVLIKIPIPKALVELMHEIIGINPVPVVGQKADRLLAGSGKIKDGKTRLLCERRAELFQTMAVPGLQLCDGRDRANA